MATLGEAKIKIRAVLGPLKKGLRDAQSLTVKAAKKIASTAMTGVKNAIKGIARTITRTVKTMAKVAVASLVAVGIASVKMAADVEESENLFNVSLGSMGDAVREWSNEISDALGLNRFEVRKFISVFNNMLKALGLGATDAAEMSKQLSLLAFDMASFFNLKPAEAFQKLTAGITGEIEPLKRLGIVINETAIKTFALKNGIEAEGEALSEVQKVLIRFNLINQQTADAQGDLARTLDSTTNVFRTIKALVGEVLVILGNELTPVITELAIVFRDWIRENQDQIRIWAKEIGTAFTNVVNIIVGFIKGLEDPTVLGRIGEAGVKIGEAIGDGIDAGLKKKFPALHTFLSILADLLIEKPRAIAAGLGQGARGITNLTGITEREGRGTNLLQINPAILERQNDQLIQELQQINRNTDPGFKGG